MLTISDLLPFTLSAFLLVISPGPNMIYLISRSITQGRSAGLISLSGIVFGFFVHVILVSFGLTALLLKIPLAYTILKMTGVFYLLYLAYQAIKPNAENMFELQKGLDIDKPTKLFSIGFLTSALNPKIAVFYLSFFPQFIKPELGSSMLQSLQLGVVQICTSFTINFLIVLSAARIASFFTQNPTWIKIQKWFMASVLTAMAMKMAIDKTK